MKQFFIKSLLFWFILLCIAILNAVLREATYKPFLTPYIGNWAHQISSFTGIIGFFVAIYWFLKRSSYNPSYRELIAVGFTWTMMTILFETWMNIFIRKAGVDVVLQTYYFWKGELWFFVLMSLVISPLVAKKLLRT